jgi:segregation and condensation protein B
MSDALIREYSLRQSGIEIRSFQDRYVMQVRAHLAEDVVPVAPKEIEAPLIRTLAVIAYKQPIMQSELSKIRGNKSYDHVKELERMGLISSAKKGRSKELRTTRAFAEYFGLESDRPEFVKQAIGMKKKRIGVTPMFKSLAERLALEHVVVNPYKPDKEDRRKLKEVDLLILSPGYKDAVKNHYFGEMLEVGTRTLTQLHRGLEDLERDLGTPVAESLKTEIDMLLNSYRAKAKFASPMKPLTPLVEEMAEELGIPFSEEGVTVAPDYKGMDAEILIPTHQNYGMDVVERIKQRYEAFLAKAAPGTKRSSLDQKDTNS